MYITIVLATGFIWAVTAGPCLPGEEQIGANTSFVCKECADGYYSRNGEKCQKCSQCYRDQIVVYKCLKTRNIQCLCPQAHYLSPKALTCIPCINCVPGTMESLDCGHNRNRECQTCPTGQTTNSTNANKCLPKTPSPDIKISHTMSTTGMVVGMVVFLSSSLLVLLVVCVYYKLRWKKKIRQQPEAVNDSLEDIPLNVLVEDNGTNVNHRLVRELPANIYEDLGLKLNPEHAQNRNWEHLAGRLQLSQDRIGNLRLQPCQATQNLLNDWGTGRESTVYRLYNILRSMHRNSAADIIEQYVYQCEG